MKKFLTIAAILLMNFVLVACGENALTSTVSGTSMYPAIGDGDTIKVSRTKNVKRSDIIMYEHDFGNGFAHGVARVIGIAGDKIEFVFHEDFQHYEIYLNDELLLEDYISEPTKNSGTALVYNVGANEIFVMGDNRSVNTSDTNKPFSTDSRTFGNVSANKIVGVVVEIIKS